MERPQIPLLPRDDASITQLRSGTMPSGERLGLYHLCPECSMIAPVFIIKYPFHMECASCSCWVDIAVTGWVRLEYPKVGIQWQPWMGQRLPYDADSLFTDGVQSNLKRYLSERELASEAESILWDSWKILVYNEMRPGNIIRSANLVYETDYQDWLTARDLDPEDQDVVSYYEDRGCDYLSFPCPIARSGVDWAGCSCDGDGWYCFLSNYACYVQDVLHMSGPPQVLKFFEIDWPFDWFPLLDSDIITFSNPHGHDNMIDLLPYRRAS